MISWSLLRRLSSVTILSRQSFMFVFYVPSSLRDNEQSLMSQEHFVPLLVWKTKRAISQVRKALFVLACQNTSWCVLVGTVFHVHHQRHTLSVSDGKRHSSELKSRIIEVSLSLIGWRTCALCVLIRPESFSLIDLFGSGFVPKSDRIIMRDSLQLTINLTVQL